MQACLGDENFALADARCIKQTVGREVWQATLAMLSTISGPSKPVMIIIVLFKPCSADQINTNLAPGPCAKKCALAMQEMPALGIPTPQVLGEATQADEAAIVMAAIEPTQWISKTRSQAAETLARLHRLPLDQLSTELQALVLDSDPREVRTTGGAAPKPARQTLVHGDYFSANILPQQEGIVVIDWETLGIGDPMWDLGFLIGADRDLDAAEIEQIIAAYTALASVDREQLAWHQHRWQQFWH